MADFKFDKKLWTGKYNYINGQENYGDEEFTIAQEDKRSPRYQILSTINSRVSTGEFLRINVDYIMNSQYDPVIVTITRTMGGRESVETFNVDLKEKIIHYHFKSSEMEETNNDILPSNRFQISTPAFVTTLLPTMIRKIDPVARSSFFTIISSNIWKYQKKIQEKKFFLEQKSTSAVELIINKNKLTASYFHIYQHEKAANIKEEGIPIYMSKNFNIPYKMQIDENNMIIIDTFKSLDTGINKMF